LNVEGRTEGSEADKEKRFKGVKETPDDRKGNRKALDTGKRMA